jgi:hypothetical protein
VNGNGGYNGGDTGNDGYNGGQGTTLNGSGPRNGSGGYNHSSLPPIVANGNRRTRPSTQQYKGPATSAPRPNNRPAASIRSRPPAQSAAPRRSASSGNRSGGGRRR